MTKPATRAVARGPPPKKPKPLSLSLNRFRWLAPALHRGASEKQRGVASLLLLQIPATVRSARLAVAAVRFPALPIHRLMGRAQSRIGEARRWPPVRFDHLPLQFP
jgi:hypothetical protein